MTDQTRWGIDQVQLKNKVKSKEEQKQKREDMVSFVLNCTAYDLQKMYERMKELKK